MGKHWFPVHQAVPYPGEVALGFCQFPDEDACRRCGVIRDNLGRWHTTEGTPVLVTHWVPGPEVDPPDDIVQMILETFHERVGLPNE